MEKKLGSKHPKTKYRTMLIKDLVELGILEIGEFELKHHESMPEVPKSPFKINLRTKEYGGPLIPNAVKAIGEEIFDYIRREKLKFDFVIGLPQAGEPFAEVVSQLSGKSSLRLEKKIIEGKRRITGVAEGKILSGYVLLIDDVITFGSTLEEAVSVVEAAKLIVSAAVTFVDRYQGGVERIKKLGCRVYSIFGILDIIYICKSKGIISPQKCDEIERYIHANQYPTKAS